jgi:hypothetical protein
MKSNDFLPKATKIVARSGTCFARLGDNRYFAWEIVRRRHDYVAAPVSSERLRDGRRPIDLIRSLSPDPAWGLRFRRKSRAVRRGRSLILVG